jgi:uncharacterized protein (DUF2147 family)
MFRITLIAIIQCYQFLGQSQADPDKIIGVWLNEEGTNKIEIYKVDDTYSGKIIWIAQLEKHPGVNPKDKNNPDPQKRNRAILGMDIITGLKYSNGKWINGTIYNPEKGVHVNCKVELSSDTELSLVASKGPFSQTKVWTKE